jgi:predicted RNA-binding Zn-ribbon protein involved in translation (DUF1610 family)
VSDTKIKSVKRCPMCKSTEIFLDGRLIAMGQFYTCNKCGYSGQFVIEEDK